MNESLDIQFIDRLKSVYGDSIEMTDDRGEIRVLSLAAEFEYRNRAYAVLLPEGERDAEPDLFRIVQGDAEQWQLESINDDDEWEEVMERYDEVAYRDAF
ncbi:DUF1292 domain-containing protein [Paenibacillus profundus]|uniref:DUF1292 domain-containing protein n=1 Tax=Paenibacillus profundus TaxID=1173085 RepID=A0ABS8YN77_9BACL|nr:MULTISPECIES: DUF1292 domain-containing protein [Paenibacillus]MCE5171756.1 DUF1292 domain-containing protein [Paenibacillus profundus]MCM3339491.1 DUF1292 domain-containing protein [Paenibacillus sp. MER TA 81-3]